MIAKIAAVVPEPMRRLIAAPSVGVRPRAKPAADWIDASQLRQAIRKGLKVRLRYRSETQEETERTVWPIIFGYADASAMLIAWCELRQDFRHFRIDRVIELGCSRRRRACAEKNYARVGYGGATPGLARELLRAVFSDGRFRLEPEATGIAPSRWRWRPSR